MLKLDVPYQTSIAQAQTDEGEELCDRLGVEVLPTLQFFRNGVKLYEHRGVMEMEQGVGEGARRGVCKRPLQCDDVTYDRTTLMPILLLKRRLGHNEEILISH